MENETKLLPVGSVVYLKEGTQKVVVLARGQLIKVNEQDEKQTYFEYMGTLYPQGFDVNHILYFNNNDIENIIWNGYNDEEEIRYLDVLENWLKKNFDNITFGKSNHEN